MSGRFTGRVPKLGRPWSTRLGDDLEAYLRKIRDSLGGLQSAEAQSTPTTVQHSVSASKGTSQAIAAADHQHALSTTGDIQSVGTANADGSAVGVATKDHVHNLPTTVLRTLGTLFWTKYTVTHTDLQAATTTNDIELFSLPAQSVIHGVIVKHSAAFAGGSLTAYTVNVGVTGELDRYSDAFDVFQAPADTEWDNNFAGAQPEDFGSATSIRIAATATGDNLDQTTAGSVDVWVCWSTLP